MKRKGLDLLLDLIGMGHLHEEHESSTRRLAIDGKTRVRRFKSTTLNFSQSSTGIIFSQSERFGAIAIEFRAKDDLVSAICQLVLFQGK